MILALKTAGDPTEIYLLDDSGEVVRQKIWNAERKLAHDLLGEIEQLVIAGAMKQSSDDSKTGSPRYARDDNTWNPLSGIIVFKGPGSFTGLRIGITTANTIAYAENIPIVGADGEEWRANGLEKLKQKRNDKIVMPEYGAEPNITKPKK